MPVIFGINMLLGLFEFALQINVLQAVETEHLFFASVIIGEAHFMQSYPHEGRHTQENQSPMNTVWPLMSTDGVDVDDYRDYLLERGLSSILADENGWYPSRNANDNFLRVVIPAKTLKTGHVYWQARAVSKNVHVRYQSPKGPRHGAIVLVRAYPDEEHSERVVVVEGPMDALAAADCGYDSFALMGIDPGKEAINHLVALVEGRKALVVLDNEPAAQSAASRIALTLASAGGRAHVQCLTHTKDLASLEYELRSSWLDTFARDI